MKRFTDTEKWEDPWFCELGNEYKLLWIYILDKCDNAGVWKVNMKTASFFIGFSFQKEEVLKILGDRVQVIKNGSEDKWFIKKFIFFQCGNLSEACKPHLKVISLLKQHRLYIDYTKTDGSLKEKEKDKEEEKEKEEKKKKYGEFALLAAKEHEKLCTDYGKAKINDYVERLNDYIGSTGKKYKSHYHTIKNWIRMGKDEIISKKTPRQKAGDKRQAELKAGSKSHEDFMAEQKKKVADSDPEKIREAIKKSLKE